MLPEKHHPAVRIFQHVRHRLAEVDLPKPPLVRQPHDDQVGPPFDGLIHQRRAGVTRLYQLSLDRELGSRGQLLTSSRIFSPRSTTSSSTAPRGSDRFTSMM